MIKGFRDLEVCQKAHKLALEVYKVSHSFPRNEPFGITSQLRRAAYSMPANLVEEYPHHQFLAIANGSAEELRYFLIRSRDLRYLSAQEEARLEPEITGIVQMIAALARSLKVRLKEKASELPSRTTGHRSRNTKPTLGVQT